jgi:SulP family sulfate permease
MGSNRACRIHVADADFLPHHLGPYPETDPGIRAGNDCRLRLQAAVQTIVTRFGGFLRPPHLQLPKFRIDLIHGLLGPAFTVAILGAMESLTTAVVSDRMSNDRHNPNVEWIGQGVANIFSSLCRGLRESSRPN